MKKDLWKYLSLFNGIINPHPEVPEEVEPDSVSSELDNIINEIFSVDPKTGLPKGDLQYYMSADGNPEVKAWLEENLLKPRSVASKSSMEDVTDDLIAEMTRNVDESSDDYVARLASIRDEAIINSAENKE